MISIEGRPLDGAEVLVIIEQNINLAVEIVQ
jgi:hypothetical protein